MANNTINSNAFDQVITDLIIISKIETHEKISTYEGNLSLQKSTNLDWFYRWFYGETRGKALDKLKQIIENSLSFSQQALQSEVSGKETNSNCGGHLQNSFILEKVMASMKEAIPGLENLKITYKDDVKIVAQITLLIDKIFSQVEFIEKKTGIKVKSKKKKKNKKKDSKKTDDSSSEDEDEK